MPPRMHVEVDAADPYERGRQRGSQIGAQLQQTWPIYQRLFAVTARDASRDQPDVEAIAGACLDSLSTWSPDLIRELEGVAAGADVPLLTVVALNARTEVLAQARGAGATECSTLVQLPGIDGSAVSAQTWDWHHDLAGGWHLQTCPRRPVRLRRAHRVRHAGQDRGERGRARDPLQPAAARE